MPSQGNTTERGYGAEHQALRAKYARRMKAGEQFTCWRCGGWINPAMPWDLGHDDHDRSIYRGPEHRGRECSAGGNRATKGRQPKGVAGRRTPDAKPRVRACEICGAQYKASGRDQRTCSRACGWELRRRNTPIDASIKDRQRAEIQRNCSECGQIFGTTHNLKLTCSAECSKTRQRRTMREYYHINPEYREATITRAKARRWKL